MEALNKLYTEQLEAIKQAVSESEVLEQYLDTEEEEDYKALQEAFEPAISDLHASIANADPMQLLDFESQLLDERLEGLFLPRILGYSVLRGDIDEKCRYKYAQEHFKEILLCICNSMNFDYIKLRIGQTVQIGFALSTTIWVTDLLDNLQNKNVKRFLTSQRLLELRDDDKRLEAYDSYRRQFTNFNFMTSYFPKDIVELKKYGAHLQKFLLYRAGEDLNNESLMPYIDKFLDNKDFLSEPEFVRICIVLSMYFDLDDKILKKLKGIFNALRTGNESFEDEFFRFYLEFIDDKAHFKRDAVTNMSKVIDAKVKDELTNFFDLMRVVYDKGYVDEDSINAIRKYYNQHMGLSDQNRCLRHAINNRFSKVLNDLGEDEYTEYFELNKVFGLYMDIFANEKFNQTIKYISLDYVKRLLKFYTDKRGKDYQDIKKFVSTTFLEYKFFDDKEIGNLFKSKRRTRKLPQES